MTAILQWIGSFLGWLSKTTGSYVMALFIFALIIEILLLPFAIKQQKTSQKQARLRPKEMAIRKKYAGRDDQVTRQKMTEEIQQLYMQEKFSPLSGCLPLLIQFPIIIALYNIVINPLKYVIGMSQAHINAIGQYMIDVLKVPGITAGGKSTIEYISKMKELGKGAFQGMQDTGALEALNSAFDKGLPNFHMFDLNLAETPSFTAKGTALWLLVIPVLTFVVYFLSMRISRKLNPPPMADDAATGCSNKMMDFTMPLMSVGISFMVPAAIGVYWIFKSIVTTIKQFIVSKAMPLPTFTEEDYKAAEKELKGKSSYKKVVKSENVGKVRSLHHIDDDDFEDEVPQNNKKNKNNKNNNNNNSKNNDNVGKETPSEDKKEPENNGGLIEKARLKDDADHNSKKEKNSDMTSANEDDKNVAEAENESVNNAEENENK